MNAAYFIATLPTLTLEGKPPFTPQEFVALCRDNLDPADAAAAAALACDEPSDHPFSAAWLAKETIWRNAAARLRAPRRGGDPATARRPVAEADLRAEAAVEAAFPARDPLQRERLLDTLRWSLAEELQGYDPLDVKAVLAYAVKLRLCAAWAARRDEAAQAASATLLDIPITLDR